MEQACQVFITAYRGVEDILRGYAQRKRPRIDHFQPVWMQVQEDVTALGVRTVYQRVDQQFAHHDFIEGGHVLAVQAIG